MGWTTRGLWPCLYNASFRLTLLGLRFGAVPFHLAAGALLLLLGHRAAAHPRKDIERRAFIRRELTFEQLSGCVVV
jgi:hypothetical protein